MTEKCGCSMTGTEILEDHVRIVQPVKSLLVVDTGSGWTVTMFGPDNAGLGTDHITIQSALTEVERCMVNLRRQPDHMQRGTIITDQEQIASELRKGF